MRGWVGRLEKLYLCRPLNIETGIEELGLRV